jgi:hypothetical protein
MLENGGRYLPLERSSLDEIHEASISFPMDIDGLGAVPDRIFLVSSESVADLS